jgi:hypothetical protein
MTENRSFVDMTGFTCPKCGEPTDDTTSLNQDPDERPKVGDVSFCFECGTALEITSDGLEQIPEEKLEELRHNSKFAKAEILGKVLAIASHMPGFSEVFSEPDEADTITIEHGDHTHTVPAVPGGVPVIIEGGKVRLLDGPDLPDGMQALIKEAIERQRVDEQAREIKKYVTAEVANYVLSAYGNEQASMPSLSVSALISLIRTCAISDEDMLDDLNQANSEFHGYVLAIMLLAEQSIKHENDIGFGILRRIAGIDPPLENEEDRARDV